MSATTDEIAVACDLTPWTGDPTTCRWCERPLVGRQTTWCSAECGERFAANHRWTEARWAAVTRDGWSCRRCWRGPAFAALLRLTMPGVDPRSDPVVWAAVWEASTMGTPEVHHEPPVFGQRGAGCQHHQSGLLTCCGACHRAEDARWRGIRRALKAAFGIDLAAPEREAVPVAA